MARRPRAARAADPSKVIFTIASANYLAHAATLMQSVRTHHPEATRVIVLADALRPFDALDLAAELLPCDALGIALIGNMKLWYSCIEFNTSIKPYAFQHFMAHGAEEVIYLDPDIQLFARLDQVYAALDTHSIVLTPHITKPLEDGEQPDDLAILKSGVYNLGFLAARRDPPTAQLLRWWAARTYLHCRVDVTVNLFTDQRWMDLAPGFVAQSFILRDPGCNVAYWNVAHRHVHAPAAGQWMVDDVALTFYHFSGLAADDPEIFSRYQTRFQMSELGAVADLCAAYRQRLHDNLWSVSSRYPYAYGVFANGRPIEGSMRRWLLRAVDEERLDGTVPLDISSEFFDEADETAAARGISVTRTMYQLWLDRPDLRSVFDLYAPRGRDAFFAWFTGGDAEVDGRSISAAALLHEASDADGESFAGPGAQPWEPVGAETWSGPANQADTFLRGEVWAHIGAHDLLLPRHIALLWELRTDLQEGFPLHNLDRAHEFIGWAITAGCEEAGVAANLFSDAFIAQETMPAQISARFADVPITEAMRATRKVTLRRDYLNGWEQFPDRRLGRLSHGFWFAFVAARAFRWPDALVAPVRGWFAELTETRCADFIFNRAQLALWELRTDLQSIFPLTDARSCWGFLHWICTDGLRELQLDIDEFDPRLREFLTAASPRMYGSARMVEMIYEARADLRAAFDVDSAPGRAGLDSWVEHHFAADYGSMPLGRLRSRTPADPIVAEPVQAALALVGQWHVASGRGEDIRGSAQALDLAGFADYLVVDRDSGEVRHADGRLVAAGAPIDVEVAVFYLNAQTALMDWTFLQRCRVGAKRIIGFWAWELDRLPRAWLHAFSFFDEIWASSSFARAAFSREGLRPVTLVPMTVALPPIAPLPRRSDETLFVFMFDFQSFASRKNPEGVVQAFLSAFPEGDEKVRLLIKTQGAARAAAAWRRLNALCADPRIDLRDESLDRLSVLQLVAGADVFVSLHRSEGFGRAPAEAMLLGCPVIATGYSGTSDFIASDCAYVVGYTMRPVAPGEYPGADGQSWAEPDLAEAARLMRRAHEHPEEARALGERGRARVQDLYNPGRAAKAMFQALGLAKPGPRRRAGKPRKSSPGA